MLKRAEKIGEIIKNSKEIHIVTHIDADGITAGTIAYQTLKRLGKECTIEFIKDLDLDNLERLKNENHELVWFTDLDSSISTDTPELNKIITAHHSCPENSNKPFHLNPHLFGLDGSLEICGAGVTYLVSRAIDRNRYLSKIPPSIKAKNSAGRLNPCVFIKMPIKQNIVAITTSRNL